jgi:glycosyltransferase involved in cell wall biosynthesis
MQKMSVSVIIPCLNEGNTIYGNIKKINSYLSSNFDIYEIIAVNDGSQDNTVSEIKRFQSDFSSAPLHIIDNEINEGKGKVVTDGILKSSHSIVMFLDADLAIPIEELGKFVREIEGGCDLAIASRFVPGLKIMKPVLWYRKFMERVFRIMRMVIIDNYTIKDTQCGFKVFRREVAMDIFPLLKVRRFAFDAEIIHIATIRKYKVKELPITLQNPTASSIRIIRDSWNMFLDLIRIRLNSSKGYYKKR